MVAGWRVGTEEELLTITASDVIIVTSADGGEPGIIGSVHDLRWSSNIRSGTVRVELSRDGGGSFQTVVASQPGSPGFYDWTVTGPLTTQAVIRLSSVETPTLNDVSWTSFTIQPSRRISSVAFSSPMATLGDTVELHVEVTHGAGFPVGWPVTVQAVITLSGEQMHVTLARDRETQPIQTTSSGTLLFTFPVTVENDSDGGVMTGTAAFLPSTGKVSAAPLLPCETCDDSCHVLTASIKNFHFLQSAVGPGDDSPVVLEMEVQYWTPSDGQMKLEIRKKSPDCATTIPTIDTRSVPFTAAPDDPVNGHRFIAPWGVLVSNHCQTQNTLRFEGSILEVGDLPGLIRPRLNSNEAELMLQPPNRLLRTTVLNPPVMDEDNPKATISGTPFTLQVEAINPTTNQRDTSFNGQVMLSFILPQSVSGESINPSTINLQNGVGTTQVVAKVVLGTATGRFIQLSGLFVDTSTVLINVWFSVFSTREGLVGGTTACGRIIQPNDHFVALPSTGLCNVGVILTHPAIGSTTTTTIQDVGPWCPHSSATPGNPCVCGNDRYWNTSGVPLVESLSCDANNSGIDLADGTHADLGSPSVRQRILWRFR